MAKGMYMAGKELKNSLIEAEGVPMQHVKTPSTLVSPKNDLLQTHTSKSKHRK